MLPQNNYNAADYDIISKNISMDVSQTPPPDCSGGNQGLTIDDVKQYLKNYITINTVQLDSGKVKKVSTAEENVQSSGYGYAWANPRTYNHIIDQNVNNQSDTHFGRLSIQSKKAVLVEVDLSAHTTLKNYDCIILDLYYPMDRKGLIKELDIHYSRTYSYFGSPLYLSLYNKSDHDMMINIGMIGFTTMTIK